MPNDRSAGCRVVVFATYAVGLLLLPFFSYSSRRPFRLEQAVLAAASL